MAEDQSSERLYERAEAAMREGQLSDSEHTEGKGLNLAKVLEDPPADLFNLDRIQQEGIRPIYLEPQKDRKQFDVVVVFAVASAFNGPFGFITAARMN